MRTERIGTPKGTHPFAFRRAGKYKNEWYCYPNPWDTHTDDDGEEWPMYRFCLLYDRQMGWCAAVEGCIVMMHHRIQGYGDYDELCAEWFKTLPEAVAYLKGQLVDWERIARGNT